MNKNKIEVCEPDALSTEITHLFAALREHQNTMSRLLAACNEPIQDHKDLCARMVLIKELYSHSNSVDHPAARFAENVADRVHEYEAKTVVIASW